MRGQTGALIGLKHTIAERISLRHLEIRGDVGRLHVLKLGMRRGGRTTWAIAIDPDPVGAVHFAALVHRQKSRVGMVEIVSHSERRRREWDDSAGRTAAATRDVGSPGNQNRIVEKIVGSAVFLDDNDDMLDLPEGEWRDGVIAACVKAKQQSSSANQQNHETDDCVPLHRPDARGHAGFLGCLAALLGLPS